MANTVTSFHTFYPSTSGFAVQILNNFYNFRGDRIPIHTATASSTTGTYDIGAQTKNWNVGYFSFADMVGDTTTNLWRITAASETLPSLMVLYNSTTKYKFSKTPNWSFNTVTSQTINGTTTNNSFTTIFTASITTYGRNVFISLLPAFRSVDPTTTELTSIYTNSTSLAYRISRDSQTISYFYAQDLISGSGTTISTSLPFLDAIDNSVTAGGHTYRFEIYNGISNTVLVENMRMVVREMV